MRRLYAQESGSALILVILFSLILSALAVVALRSVSMSVHQSAVYQTRQQSYSLSDSIVQVFARRVGFNAALYTAQAEAGSYGQVGMDPDAETGIYGGGFDLAEREELATRGAFLQRDSSQDSMKTWFLGPGFDPMEEETGIFGSATMPSFESQRGAGYQIIMRDPVDGIAAPGYGDGFCFKRVLFASQARVGEEDIEWSQANNIAFARHGIDGLVGPIDCGNR